MFSSTGYAEWTEVSESVANDTFYVDFERVRKVNGYVYYWILTDYLIPSEFGDLSAKQYNQGDCKNFRFLSLSYVFHKEPMGEGRGDVQASANKNWQYPVPDSVNETLLKNVCGR